MLTPERIDAAASEWVYIRSGRESEQYAELRDFARAIEALVRAECVTPVEAVSATAEVMEQAQVFASAWSLVGGRFDSGSALDDANEAKDELRRMVQSLATLAAAPSSTPKEPGNG